MKFTFLSSLFLTSSLSFCNQEPHVLCPFQYNHSSLPFPITVRGYSNSISVFDYIFGVQLLLHKVLHAFLKLFLLLTLHWARYNFAFKICKLLLNQWVIKWAQLPRDYLFHSYMNHLNPCSYNIKLLQPKSLWIYTKKKNFYLVLKKDDNFVGLYKRLQRQFNIFTVHQKYLYQPRSDLIHLPKKKKNALKFISW